MIHLITTRVVEKTCGCGALIYAGYAEGRPVRVDAKPLADQRHEVDALLEGRTTYALTRWTRELVHRDAGRIRTGLVGQSIHALHRCQTYTQPSLIGAAR